MSISGVPPFSGFWSKLLIILAAVAAGKFWYAFWAIVASVLTLAAFLKVFKCSFRGALTEATAKAREVPVLMRSAMLILALICIFGGGLMLTKPRSVFLAPAVNVLLSGQQYSKTVLEDLP
jgi:multicomponent Na+:H+ antiporter subunit D